MKYPSDQTTLLGNDLESGDGASVSYGTLTEPSVVAKTNRLDTAWSSLHNFSGAAGSGLFSIFALAVYAIIPTVTLASSIAGFAGGWGIAYAFVKWNASDKPFDLTAKALGERLNEIETFMTVQNDMMSHMVRKLECLASEPGSAEFLSSYAQLLAERLSAIKPAQLNEVLFNKIIAEVNFRLRDKVEMTFDVINGFLSAILIPGFWLLTANGFLHPALNPDDPSAQLGRKVWFDGMSAGLGVAFGAAGAAMSIRSILKQYGARDEIMTGFKAQLNQIDHMCIHSNELLERARELSQVELLTQGIGQMDEKVSDVRKSAAAGRQRFGLITAPVVGLVSSDRVAENESRPVVFDL